MQAREVYFKYFPSQRMAHTKAIIKRRAVVGIKTIPQPLQPRPRREDWDQNHPSASPATIEKKDHSGGKVYKKEILARYKRVMRDSEVSKVNRTVNPQNSISEGCERIITMGIYMVQDPGGCCLGPS